MIGDDDRIARRAFGAGYPEWVDHTEEPHIGCVSP